MYKLWIGSILLMESPCIYNYALLLLQNVLYTHTHTGVQWGNKWSPFVCGACHVDILIDRLSVKCGRGKKPDLYLKEFQTCRKKTTTCVLFCWLLISDSHSHELSVRPNLSFGLHVLHVFHLLMMRRIYCEKN